MKTTRILLVAALVCLSFMGCKENNLPCTDIMSDYAPEELAISWTEYNSPKAINDYFKCYQGTLWEHVGDTLAVRGKNGQYLYWSDGEEYGYEWSIWLTDGEESVKIEKIPGEMSRVLHEGWGEYYVIGRLDVLSLSDGGCCSNWPKIIAIDFDTVPHYELINTKCLLLTCVASSHSSHSPL